MIALTVVFLCLTSGSFVASVVFTSTCEKQANQESGTTEKCPVFTSCCNTRCNQTCHQSCASTMKYLCKADAGHVDRSATYCKCGQPLVDLTLSCLPKSPTNTTTVGPTQTTKQICHAFDACCKNQCSGIGQGCSVNCMSFMDQHCIVTDNKFTGDTKCHCGAPPADGGGETFRPIKFLVCFLVSFALVCMKTVL